MKRWLEIALVLALTGCSSAPQIKTDNQTVKAAEKLDVPVLAEESLDDIDSSIEPAVLYLLMAAELAGQRNQYGLALDGYLQAARKVDDPRVAKRAAQIGMFIKDQKKTQEAVEIWLKYEPENLTARKIATLNALRSAERGEAVQHLSAAMELDPAGFESTLVEMGRLMEKDGKYDFVFDVLEDLSAKHPDQAVIFFVQSVFAAKQQKTQLAMQKIEAALAIQPEWRKALVYQVQLAGRDGDFDLALKSLDKAQSLKPDDQQLLKMKAQLMVDAKRYPEAESLYQQFYDKNPEDVESQFAIALLQLQQKKIDQAEKSFKALLTNSQWKNRASFYLGRIAFDNKNYDQALVWFDKVTSGGFAFDSAASAVSVLLNQKKFDEAAARIDEMELKYPDKTVKVLRLKAEMFNESKGYQKAFDILTEALHIEPENRDLLYIRALVAEELDRLDILENDLKKILSKKPNDAAALNALGYTLVDRTDRYSEAESYLLKALELEPDEPVIIDSYGWLQYKRGNLMEAIQYLRQAFNAQAENEIAAHLAEVLWVSGNKKEALKVFDQAILKSPEDEYLLDFKERFLNQAE